MIKSGIVNWLINNGAERSKAKQASNLEISEEHSMETSLKNITLDGNYVEGYFSPPLLEIRSTLYTNFIYLGYANRKSQGGV